MAHSIQQNESTTLTVTDSASTTCVIDLRDLDGGHFQVVSGTVVALTWSASVDGSTYKAAVDGVNSPVTQTVNTTNDFPIPTTLNGRRFLRPVAGSGTSGVILVGLKRASQS